MRGLFVLLLVLSMNAPAIAAEPKDEVYGLADEFGVCGGAFYALEDVLKQSGKATAAQSMRDLGDGYNMAGGWLLFMAEKISNLGKANAYVQGHAMTEKGKLLADLAKASDDTAKQEKIAALKTKVKDCNATYGEMERKNVALFRKHTSGK